MIEGIPNLDWMELEDDGRLENLLRACEYDIEDFGGVSDQWLGMPDGEILNKANTYLSTHGNGELQAVQADGFGCWINWVIEPISEHLTN